MRFPTLDEVIACFFEGNKLTAVVIARWFIQANTAIDPDQLIGPDDHHLGTLLIAAARGERTQPRRQSTAVTRWVLRSL